MLGCAVQGLDRPNPGTYLHKVGSQILESRTNLVDPRTNPASLIKY